MLPTRKANKDFRQAIAARRDAKLTQNADVICVHYKSRVPLANVGRCICGDAKAAGLRVAVLRIERD